MRPDGSVIRFGAFQLDVVAGQLLKNGRTVRIKPQPFKLLHLLASRPGELVTREEIRQVLWGGETYVDFEGGVNTAVRQIRDALGDAAERALYVETVPKRGYRFIGPADSSPAGGGTGATGTDLSLQKVLWLNIAELRLAEERRRRLRRRLLAGAAVLALIITAVAALTAMWGAQP